MTKFASALAAVALLTAASGAKAEPQIQANFYQESVIKSCGGFGSTTCVAKFTPIASGKTLVVRQIDCRIIATNGITIYGTALHSFGNTISGFSYLTGKTEKAINPAGTTAWVYSANVMNMFSGTAPTITSYATSGPGTYTTFCTIVGTYG